MDKILRALLHSAPGETIPIRTPPPRAAGTGPAADRAAGDALSDDSRRLFEAWRGWRGDALLPRRADMKLETISRLMPRLVVLDVRSPEQIVFRLAGTEVEAHYGQRLTGRSYVRMAPPERQRQRGALLWRIVAQPCGVLEYVAFDWRSGRQGVLEIFGLPVLHDRDGEPVQMLGVISRLPPPRIWSEADSVVAMRRLSLQFIDIGAGVPAQDCSDSAA